MPFMRTMIRDRFALLLPVLLFALFVRALVPQGYMPASGGERLVSIRLCSAMSAGRSVDFAVQPDGGNHGEDGGNSADMPCAFQSLGMMALGSIPEPVALLNLRHLLAQGFSAPAPMPAAGPASLPPPATGPPTVR